MPSHATTHHDVAMPSRTIYFCWRHYCCSCFYYYFHHMPSRPITPHHAPSHATHLSSRPAAQRHADTLTTSQKTLPPSPETWGSSLSDSRSCGNCPCWDCTTPPCTSFQFGVVQLLAVAITHARYAELYGVRVREHQQVLLIYKRILKLHITRRKKKQLVWQRHVCILHVTYTPIQTH